MHNHNKRYKCHKKSLVESYFVKKHTITINLTVKLQICRLYTSIGEAFKNWYYISALFVLILVLMLVGGCLCQCYQ